MGDGLFQLNGRARVPYYSLKRNSINCFNVAYMHINCNLVLAAIIGILCRKHV